MKKILFFVSLLLLVNAGYSQDLKQYKKDIKTLSSKKMEGRGYCKNGMNKAAAFLAKEFEKIGVEKVNGSYYQAFSYDVNVFPGKAEVKIDGKKLLVGEQWVAREFSPGCHGVYDIYYVDTVNFDGKKLMSDINTGLYDEKFIVIDWDFYRTHYRELNGFTQGRQKGIICRWSTPLKFYKAYSDFLAPTVIIWVNSEFGNDARQIDINLDNQFFKNYQVRNVIGMIPGTKYHDSTFVVTAHYDHQGHLGAKQYYPGANDNASGTAMLLNLACYYMKNRPEYSVVFIAFAGEEAGLRGSTYYANNPMLPLENIKYLVNLDMIGDNGDNLYAETNISGERGLRLFETINNENQFFNSIQRGELAGNSDHFPFTEKNVPAILMMFEEGDAFPYYHTYKDTVKTMSFDSFEKIFKMITTFVNRY